MKSGFRGLVWGNEVKYSMYAKMKRKVAKGGRLRLSPNEEALLLKEEYERRRRLRLQQVREQERYIAVQIRQEVKQRRDEQLHQLAEELKAEWWKAQNQKIKALEKLYLSSLRAVGDGHRQAKENEPDLVALAKEAEERKQRAEKRHKEALKEQKNQKEKLLKEQTWRTNARKHAMYVEKERAAKIASLPPPPPHPFENLEVKRLPTVKVYNADNFSVTHHHLSEPYVDREMDTQQPDARLVAEEEAKRLDELQKEGERDRREQLEKAHLRGSHALKMVHLAQDRERLMKELEQMQNMDLARRRQIVAQMPSQLFEPAYRRMEIKEDWQRELEFAFEDMYSGDRKMKGDMILHLEPQPLPIPSDRSQDEDLDISLEPDVACETQPKMEEVTEKEAQHPSEPENHEMRVAPQPQSKLVLKKLLNKIRSQKDQWTSKCEAEIQSEIETIESGTLTSEERRLCDSDPGHEQHTDSVSEAIESPEMLEHTVIAGNSVLIHPQEQAAKIRMEVERQKQIERIEQQKQQQLILLKQIEEKRMCLEAEFLRVQMQAQLEEIKKKEQEEKAASVELSPDPLVNRQGEVEHETETAAVPGTSSSNEENHIQMIRNYQQCLLLQNRLHKQSVEEARKQLQEYQNKLKQRYPSISMPSAVTLQSRFINLKPTTCESVLQMRGPTVLHRDYPSASQSSVHVHVQEYAPPLTTHSRTHFVLEKPFEQSDDEQRHNMGSSRQIQSIEASQLEQRQFHLPQQNYPSQEQMEILGPSDNQVRDLSESQKLPGSIMMTSQDSSVMMQTEAHIQQDSSTLPTEESSESSRTLDLDKTSVMSQKMPNLLIETEAQKQPQLIVLGTPAAEGSLIAQAASFDSSEYQQVPTESSIKTTFEQTIPQPFQHLTSLSPDESETGASQESLASKNGGASLLNYSSILKLRERVLASSESIQAQQDHLKELQEQLDVQREALLSRQRMQEELLLRKQAKLKEQMQRQQEALKDFLNKQAEESVTYREMTETPKSDHFNLMTYLFKDAENKSQEVNCGDVNKYDENRLLSQSISQAEQIEQSQRILGREQRWRTAKPPLAKIKLGLDLEQHELSVIPELDTPRSGKVSFADKTDSVGGEASLISSVEELVSGMCNSESVHEERDLSIANWKEQGSSENPRCTNQLSSSWHERLMVDASSSHEPANPKDSVVMGQDLPIYAADIGRRVITDSGPSFRPDSTVALSKGLTTSFAPQACARETACDYLSSTTISTGSFLTSEKLDLSPANTELSSNSAEDRILRETASSPLDSSASPTPTTAQQRQENSSEVSEFHLPAEENFISNRSQIQQIIDKYTKDLNWLPENTISFHAPAVGLDFSDMERNFPNFQRQLFQPLEPSPDFDISSSLSQHRISEDSKDFSKSFAFSIQSQDTSVFPEATTSSLKARSYNLHSFLNTKKLNSTTSQAEESIKENVTLGSEESFHPLQLESTLNEHSQSTAQPIGLRIVFEQNSKIKKSENENYVSPVGDQYEGLARNIENTNLQSSVENLRSPTLSSSEELGSFYQLITTQITENETLLTEHSVKEVAELRKENLCFEELPVVTPNKHRELTETPVLSNEANRIVEGDHSQCSTNILEEEQSILEVQMSSRMPRAVDSEIYINPSQATRQQNGGLPEIPQNQNSNSVLTISSGSHSLQSRVPVWETESGHGIMEEPELTLISSNDISVAESDLEHISQEKKRKNKLDSLAYAGQSELKSCSEGRDFLPLDPEADYSVFTLPDYSAIAQSPNEDQSPLHQSAVMLLEFTSTPGSLQESFLRRKKNFIQKSSKRVEEIKNRERCSEKPQAKLFQRDKTERFNMPKEDSPTSGAVVSQLKKVGEVKVCSPEDKRSADVQMQQRTLRLYNQLAEVKIRKEEKSRQETYAKNREKAREFQKKTLEKLRAKKTH
ncbi:centrosomal protein of 295 kDa isoform X2 [Malaclemys terrapin pileata]|uniref:centrosomal protein of 295 kDa isoform X2 n=1 Tax=Malaclemys terrapin pileata TaxID=2991368 RepID=UPI0023A7CB8C|nr:centrosomal protein of 295 kDa isoform X2 [Malaclemys terrapin pileata]